MEISNSKKELARIINENGGWREGEFAAQDKDGDVFRFDSKPVMGASREVWMPTGNGTYKLCCCATIKGWHQTILSRAEYFHLYPAPDADGWIEWNGGECPVCESESIDIRFSDSREEFCTKAGFRRWYHGGDKGDIIAYRLHKSEVEIAWKSDTCTMEMPKPTIEQLASDYKSKLSIAKQAQEVADFRRGDADVALDRLCQAGIEIGLDIAIAGDKDEDDPELDITDWRDLQVGDEVEYLEGTLSDYVGLCGVVDSIDRGRLCGNYRIDVRFPDGATRWCSDWRFIRRP